MAFAGDICGYLNAIRETHPCDLPQSGVGLFRSLCFYLCTNATFLWSALPLQDAPLLGRIIDILQCRRLTLRALLFTSSSDQLIYRRHSLPPDNNGVNAPAHLSVREAIGRARWPRLITPVFNSGSFKPLPVFQISDLKFYHALKRASRTRLSVPQLLYC